MWLVTNRGNVLGSFADLERAKDYFLTVDPDGLKLTIFKEN